MFRLAARRSIAYFRTWLKLGLVQTKNKAGITYGQLSINVDEPLDPVLKAEIISIRHQYEELIKRLGIEGSDYDTTGSVVSPVTNPADEIPF